MPTASAQILLLGTLDSPAMAALRHQGAQVRSSCHLSEADRLLQTRRADLLLVDLFLPEMDGLSALRDLGRRHASLAPSILMTPASTGDRPGACGIDIRAWVSKPLIVQTLLEQVRSVLAATHAPILPPEQEPPNAPCTAMDARIGLHAEHLPADPQDVQARINLNQPIRAARRDFLRAYMQFKLDKADGCVRKAARDAKLDYSAFYRQCQDLDLRYGTRARPTQTQIQTQPNPADCNGSPPPLPLKDRPC